MWFKGADTSAVLLYLEHAFQEVEPEPEFQAYCTCILAACKHAGGFLKTVYHAGLWMTRLQAKRAVYDGFAFLQKYSQCAQIAFANSKTRFKLSPKLHAFAHLVVELKAHLGKVKGLSCIHCIPSPLAESCQMDEDFVGRVSALARTSPPASVHKQCINLFLMSLHQQW